MMTVRDGLTKVVRRPRGSRGKGSKRRSREKWLAKIGAAYAHHGEENCGLGAARRAEEDSAAHRVIQTGAAAQKTSWQDATTDVLWSGTTPKTAERLDIAPRPTECAQSALKGAAAQTAHREDAAATMAAQAGDTVDGQWGGCDLSTPGNMMDSRMVCLLVGTALWRTGWCSTTGMVTALSVVVVLVWRTGYLARGWADIEPMAATKLAPHAKLPRMTRQRRAAVELAWKRVFQVMVERGLAGELAQRKLQVKQLRAQLGKLQDVLEQTEARYAKHRNKSQNDKAKGRELQRARDEKLFQAGKAEGLREALPVELENRKLKSQLTEQAEQFNAKLSAVEGQMRDIKWKLQLAKRPGFFDDQTDQGEAV